MRMHCHTLCSALHRSAQPARRRAARRCISGLALRHDSHAQRTGCRGQDGAAEARHGMAWPSHRMACHSLLMIASPPTLPSHPNRAARQLSPHILCRFGAAWCAASREGWSLACPAMRSTPCRTPVSQLSFPVSATTDHFYITTPLPIFVTSPHIPHSSTKTSSSHLSSPPFLSHHPLALYILTVASS